MRKLLNLYSQQPVRVGEEVRLPGGLAATVCNVQSDMLVLDLGHGRFLYPRLEGLGLKWVEIEKREPWQAMTGDDWIRASNAMRELGGHFASNLAKAFQHADIGNQRPLRENYGPLFFGFLSQERQTQLKQEVQG